MIAHASDSASATNRELVVATTSPSAAGGPANGLAHVRFVARTWFALCFCIVAVVYVVGAIWMARTGGLCVSDQDARFAMVRNWVEHGDLIYLHYTGAHWDSTGRLFPLGVMTPRFPVQGCALYLNRGLCTQYPPLFPLLSGVAYRALGFGGIFVLPVLGALVTLFITTALASELGLRSRFWVPLTLGIATPLVVYAVVFWDHSVHMAIVACAAWALLQGMRRGSAMPFVTVGALLGLGVWFHELFALLLAATVVALLVTQPRGRRLLRASLVVGGFVPVFAAWLLSNVCIYGTWASPHLAGQRNLAAAGTMLRVADLAGSAREQLLGWSTWSRQDVIFLGLVLVYACASRFGRHARWLIAAPCILCGAMVLGWAQGLPMTLGLLQATPILIGCLAVPWSPRCRAAYHEGQERADVDLQFYRWAVLTCVAFAAVVLLNPQSPGGSPGSRYIMTVLPLLALLAARGLQRNYDDTAGAPRLLFLCGALVLAVASAVSQYRNVECEQHGARWRGDLAATAQRVRSQAILVAWHELGAVLASRPPGVPCFLARDGQDASLFMSVAERTAIREFTFIGDLLDAGTVAGRAAIHRPAPFVPSGVSRERSFVLVRFVQVRPGTKWPKGRPPALSDFVPDEPLLRQAEELAPAAP